MVVVWVKVSKVLNLMFVSWVVCKCLRVFMLVCHDGKECVYLGVSECQFVCLPRPRQAACVCLCLFQCICVCVWVCLGVYIYVCVCISNHRPGVISNHRPGVTPGGGQWWHGGVWVWSGQVKGGRQSPHITTQVIIHHKVQRYSEARRKPENDPRRIASSTAIPVHFFHQSP